MWPRIEQWIEEQGLVETLKPDVRTQIKEYLPRENLTQTLEYIYAALLYHKPGEPIVFVKNCLTYIKEHPDSQINMNTFLDNKELLEPPPLDLGL